jgi:hypothetical protein
MLSNLYAKCLRTFFKLCELLDIYGYQEKCLVKISNYFRDSFFPKYEVKGKYFPKNGFRIE